MSDCIIVVDHAEKRFGEQVALRDVSVSFEAGKIHGIIGRNGSGKTVLFKCIVGLMPLTSGSIQVNGRHIETGKTVPDDIGAIIETPGFLPNYSGFRNLKFLATLRGRIKDAEIRKAMQQVGLDPESRKHVGKYSLGMRQRLGIAQAINAKGEIMLFPVMQTSIPPKTRNLRMESGQLAFNCCEPPIRSMAAAFTILPQSSQR
ncbi:ATP-binding cassette domain-containing protein [Dysosmobacter sp.]|uniref:ATP-binding cassette domain-containing protein n=1 Tax=Dysosmobacter sp. TaxID=2591382 RepID=UPI003AAC8693